MKIEAILLSQEDIEQMNDPYMDLLDSINNSYQFEPQNQFLQNVNPNDSLQDAESHIHNNEETSYHNNNELEHAPLEKHNPFPDANNVNHNNSFPGAESHIHNNEETSYHNNNALEHAPLENHTTFPDTNNVNHNDSLQDAGSHHNNNESKHAPLPENHTTPQTSFNQMHPEEAAENSNYSSTNNQNVNSNEHQQKAWYYPQDPEYLEHDYTQPGNSNPSSSENKYSNNIEHNAHHKSLKKQAEINMPQDDSQNPNIKKNQESKIIYFPDTSPNTSHKHLTDDREYQVEQTKNIKSSPSNSQTHIKQNEKSQSHISENTTIPTQTTKDPTLIIQNTKTQSHISENYIKELLSKSTNSLVAKPEEYLKFLKQNLEYSQKIQEMLSKGSLSKQSGEDILYSIEFIQSEVIDIKNAINFFNIFLFPGTNLVSDTKFKNPFRVNAKINLSKNKKFFEGNFLIKLEKTFKENTLFGLGLELNLKKNNYTSIQIQSTSVLKNYFLSFYNQIDFKLSPQKTLVWRNSLGTGWTNCDAIFKYFALPDSHHIKTSYTKRKSFFLSSEIGNNFILNSISTLSLYLQVISIHLPKMHFQGKNLYCNFLFENEYFCNVIFTPRINYKLNRIINNMLELNFSMLAHIDINDSKENQIKKIQNASNNEEIFYVKKQSIRRENTIHFASQINLYCKNDSVKFICCPTYSLYLKGKTYNQKEHAFSLGLEINVAFGT